MDGKRTAEAKQKKVTREAEIQRDFLAALLDARGRLAKRGFRQTDICGLLFARGNQGASIIAVNPLVCQAELTLAATSTPPTTRIRIEANVDMFTKLQTRTDQKAWEAELDSILDAAAGLEPTDLAQRIGRSQAVKSIAAYTLITILIFFIVFRYG